LGYSPELSALLGLLCTEPLVQDVELDAKTWYVQRGERQLSQGSPASSAITDVICWRLEHRLYGLAHSLGFIYTRIADDQTFSASASDVNVGTLLRAVRRIVEDSDFVVPPDRTRVMRRLGRQEVTGLVVNDKLGVPRRHLDRSRAVLFQVERDGPQGKSFGQTHDVFDGLLGFANFVGMVDAERGQVLVEGVLAAATARKWTRTHRAPAAKREPSRQAKRRLAAEADAVAAVRALAGAKST
jgi:RNA-directed DNA polymerase